MTMSDWLRFRLLLSKSIESEQGMFKLQRLCKSLHTSFEKKKKKVIHIPYSQHPPYQGSQTPRHPRHTSLLHNRHPSRLRRLGPAQNP